MAIKVKILRESKKRKIKEMITSTPPGSAMKKKLRKIKHYQAGESQKAYPHMARRMAEDGSMSNVFGRFLDYINDPAGFQQTKLYSDLRLFAFGTGEKFDENMIAGFLQDVFEGAYDPQFAIPLQTMLKDTYLKDFFAMGAHDDHSDFKAISEEQLDEGMKEVFLSILMTMAAMGNAAQAMDIEVGGGDTITVQQLVPKLKADASPEAVGIAQKVTDALKTGKDYDNSGSLDLGELGLDYDETELIKQLVSEPETPADSKSDAEQMDLFQKLKGKLGFGKKETEPPAKKEKEKKEKSMQQKIRDANKKDGGAFRNM